MSDWLAVTTARGADGLCRCRWAGDGSGSQDVIAYHDEQWGTGVDDDAKVFEALSLGIFEGGLGWLTVLHKRTALRRAFSDFEPSRVAEFGDEEIQHLLRDSDIIRNGAKIKGIVHNAKLMADERESLFDTAQGYKPKSNQRPRPGLDPQTVSPEAVALASRLKASGYQFVGPTSVYALMQSIGVINAHIEGCFRGDDIELGY